MTRVTKAIYEITLGGESTGGDLVVARSPLVASLLVASLPGDEVTVNLKDQPPLHPPPIPTHSDSHRDEVKIRR